MIDWITGKFPFYINGLISGGEFLSIDVDGVIETRTVKRKIIPGSYSSNITIRTFNVDDKGNTCEVELSGNPVKFLQGHNLFGTSDAVNLIFETLEKISTILGVKQPLAFYDAWATAKGTISRVDINKMFSTGSRANALQWLHSASTSSRTRSQSATTRGSTVYFNGGSRRWTIKAYSKGQETELPRNNKQGLLELTPSMKAWANDSLRIELTLKSNELRLLNLHTLASFAKMDIYELFDNYWARVAMADQLELEVDLIHTLKGAVRNTYSSWLLGLDCRSIMSRTTFYRHRQELLKYGIDITIAKEQSNVIPMIRTIVLEPLGIPDWATGTELLYEPRKHYRHG